MLFREPYLPSLVIFPNHCIHDVSSHGERFLILQPSEQAQTASTQSNAVQNWFEELKQKVPTGKK